jgi:hypothetical protein
VRALLCFWGIYRLRHLNSCGGRGAFCVICAVMCYVPCAVCMAWYCSPGHGHLPPVNLPVCGFWLLTSDSCSWLLAPGSWLLASGSWLLAPGSWLLAPGFWLLATGYWLLATGSWLVAIGSWLLATVGGPDEKMENFLMHPYTPRFWT